MPLQRIGCQFNAITFESDANQRKNIHNGFPVFHIIVVEAIM